MEYFQWGKQTLKQPSKTDDGQGEATAGSQAAWGCCRPPVRTTATGESIAESPNRREKEENRPMEETQGEYRSTHPPSFSPVTCQHYPSTHYTQLEAIGQGKL